MCSWVRSSVRRWRNSGSRSLNVRVLFVSDVYFPRVNGVSTSIRTFRQDLASLGVDTWLVAPSYAAPDAPSEEPGVLRVPATKVPRDPEDRRMGWRALTRALDALPGGRFDLVHIHTPFIAHYAGVRLARRADIPAIATYHTFFEEYLHHYMPLVPAPLARFLARSFSRSQCAAVHALIAPSEPMRAVLTGYGVTTPIHVVPTGLAADRFRPGDGRAFRARAGIDAGRALVTYIGRVAHEEEDAFAAAVVRVLGDANLRQELGKRGLAYARQWSSAAMARRLAELYGQLRGAPRVLRVARASD